MKSSIALLLFFSVLVVQDVAKGAFQAIRRPSSSMPRHSVAVSGIGSCDSGIPLKMNGLDGRPCCACLKKPKKLPPRKLKGTGMWKLLYRQVAGRKLYFQYRPRTPTSNCQSGKGDVEIASGCDNDKITQCIYVPNIIVEDIKNQWSSLMYFYNEDPSKKGSLIYFPSSKLPCQAFSFIAISDKNIQAERFLNLEMYNVKDKISIRMNTPRGPNLLSFDAAGPYFYEYLLTNENLAVYLKASGDNEFQSHAFFMQRKYYSTPYRLKGTVDGRIIHDLKHVQVDIGNNQLIGFYLNNGMTDIYERIIFHLPPSSIAFFDKIVRDKLLFPLNRDSLVFKYPSVPLEDYDEYINKDEKLGLDYGWKHQVRNGLPSFGPLRLSYRRLKPIENRNMVDYENRRLISDDVKIEQGNRKSGKFDENTWEIVMQNNPFAALKVYSEASLKIYLAMHQTADAVEPLKPSKNSKTCLFAMELRRIIGHDHISRPIIDIYAKFDPNQPNSMLIYLSNTWYRYNYSAESDISQTPYNLLFHIGPMRLGFPIRDRSSSGSMSSTKYLELRQDGISRHITIWLDGVKYPNIILDTHHAIITLAKHGTDISSPASIAHSSDINNITTQKYLLEGRSAAVTLLKRLVQENHINKIILKD